ncbi:DUF1345 domain-containing protein [Aquabacterium sp.]|uniref:DUF1345 domain-containing protein n=1 Tax=Aquabacterium sp. TaxID=1872578 RepID=UPI0024888E02|nr:DUF1345 domain-containing protein [Aquabacterium sp.]MDI1259270.1 DUF1345 domain-containing protein [Aquabacterium sp.]
MSLHRNRFIRQVQVRPRLFIAAALAVAIMALLPSGVVQSLTTRMLIGWNAGVVLYLVLAGVMMVGSSHERIRWRANLEDEGQLLILVLVIVAAVASLAAIVAELSLVKDMARATKFLHIGLAITTIVSSWAFTHVMFALHYAHDYYLDDDGKGTAGGLDFPGTETPDYGDFVYFSFVIGTSAQTADVSFTNSAMRRIGLIHCVLAFLFNTTLLALTINMAASMI